MTWKNPFTHTHQIVKFNISMQFLGGSRKNFTVGSQKSRCVIILASKWYISIINWLWNGHITVIFKIFKQYNTLISGYETLISGYDSLKRCMLPIRWCAKNSIVSSLIKKRKSQLILPKYFVREEVNAEKYKASHHKPLGYLSVLFFRQLFTWKGSYNLIILPKLHWLLLLYYLLSFQIATWPQNTPK